MGGGWGMATQSSWLISFWILEKIEACSHLAFLDKKPKTSKNAIWFGFSHMLILEARSRNCNLMSHQKNEWSYSGNVISSKMLLSNGARDTVQIKATGVHLSRGDKQWKRTVFRVWSLRDVGRHSELQEPRDSSLAQKTSWRWWSSGRVLDDE